METNEKAMIFFLVLALFSVGYLLGDVHEEYRERNEFNNEILSHCMTLNFTSTCQDFDGQLPYCCKYKPELVRDGLL